MTDFTIQNTDINEEKHFREWERLVMDYEPVRRNLYEVYCKSLKKEPIVEPIVKPTVTINTSFLNRQLQELKNDEEVVVEEVKEEVKKYSDWRPKHFPNGPPTDEDGFSSEEEEEEEEEEEVVVEEVKEEVKEEFRPDPIENLNLQFFKLEIPKMKLNIKLYHKNTANKHVSFTTDSSEFYKQIVIQKEKKFWINLIDGNPYVKHIQLNKTQKDILLAAYPYDKQRLPNMMLSHIRD